MQAIRTASRGTEVFKKSTQKINNPDVEHRRKTSEY